METVITEFHEKYNSVPRNELIVFIKQVFELSSRTFFEEEVEEKEKEQKKNKKKQPKTTENVSRRHLSRIKNSFNVLCRFVSSNRQLRQQFQFQRTELHDSV